MSIHRIVLFGVFVTFFLCPGLVPAESPPERFKTFLQRGIIDEGLHLDEKAAVEELMKAIELERENPMGYAYLAMAYLFFYETSFEEKEKKNSYCRP